MIANDRGDTGFRASIRPPTPRWRAIERRDTFVSVTRPTKPSAKKRAKKAGKPRATKAVELVVSRAEFRADPDAALRRIRGGGRVWLTDAAGMRVAVISVPTERIETRYI